MNTCKAGLPRQRLDNLFFSFFPSFLSCQRLDVGGSIGKVSPHSSSPPKNRTRHGHERERWVGSQGWPGRNQKKILERISVLHLDINQIIRYWYGTNCSTCMHASPSARRIAPRTHLQVAPRYDGRSGNARVSSECRTCFIDFSLSWFSKQSKRSQY